MKIKSISKIKNEDRYDLEVLDNHNFFANSILVHNCRCLIKSNGSFSRTGKPIICVPHIEVALQEFFHKHPNVILDGELYNHELKNDFEKIISLTSRSKPSVDELIQSAELIEYHVYDCFFTDQPDLLFNERIDFLNRELRDKYDKIVYVLTSNPKNQDELDHHYELLLEMGYEGQMIRFNTPYENKRSNNLLKRKEFQDAEYIIKDVVEGSGNRSGMAGRLTLLNEDGVEFGSGIRGDEAYYKMLLENKDSFIGRKATIRYQNLTSSGIPRFPVAVAIRNYE